MLKNKKNSIIKTAASMLPTKFGVFQLRIYKYLHDNREHAVLSIGNIKKQPVITRIHSQCLTGDTFSSLKCDCGQQLFLSMQLIAKKGSGIIIYLDQEGRGIGLTQKIKAYALQEKGLDTVEANHALGLPADIRDYAIAAEILHDYNISTIILLTNNPDKIDQLDKNGIKINKRIRLESKPQKFNKKYLLAKKQKLGHQLNKV